MRYSTSTDTAPLLKLSASRRNPKVVRGENKRNSRLTQVRKFEDSETGWAAPASLRLATFSEYLIRIEANNAKNRCLTCHQLNDKCVKFTLPCVRAAEVILRPPNTQTVSHVRPVIFGEPLKKVSRSAENAKYSLPVYTALSAPADIYLNRDGGTRMPNLNNPVACCEVQGFREEA